MIILVYMQETYAKDDLNKLYEIHKKYSQGTYPEKWLELNWTHTLIIWEIAEIIANNLQKKDIGVNRELLKAGTLLHDLGVYVCYDEDLNPNINLPKYIYHGFIGAELILKEGFGEKVARFARTHSATGLTMEDIEREHLDVEKRDYIPITLEEEILCFADKFHYKFPAFSTYEVQLERVSKFDPSRKTKLDNLKRKFGIPDLTKLFEKYDPWNKEFDLWYESIIKK